MTGHVHMTYLRLKLTWFENKNLIWEEKPALCPVTESDRPILARGQRQRHRLCWTHPIDLLLSNDVLERWHCPVTQYHFKIVCVISDWKHAVRCKSRSKTCSKTGPKRVQKQVYSLCETFVSGGVFTLFHYSIPRARNPGNHHTRESLNGLFLCAFLSGQGSQIHRPTMTGHL